MFAIDAHHLVKRFGAVTAVNDVSLRVNPGEVVAFLGPNGAGKTTTIDMLLGLSKPNDGSIQLFGMAPRQAIARGLVSAVMQTGGLLKDLTIRDTLVLTASLFVQAIDVDEAMHRAGIEDIARRKVEKCSGGQQQRLRFAMALLSDPGLVVLDEPTTGMDVEGRRSFWHSIRADVARGRTVVFATHYLDEADQYADRIVLISHGSIVADGSSAEIKALASGRTVEAILPHPDIDALRAVPGVDSIERPGGGRLRVHASDSDAVLRWLITHTDAHDITVTSHNLEDAFLRLTGTGTGAETDTKPDTAAATASSTQEAMR